MSDLLPPGPWDARGNRVVTGNGQTICVVFYPRNAAEVARLIAQLPDLFRRVEEQEAELEKQSRHLGWEEEEIDG